MAEMLRIRQIKRKKEI